MVKFNLSKIKHNRIYIIIIIMSFIVYGNGINNEYSMDDNLVTQGVAKVEKGVSGIKEILTTRYAEGKQSYDYRPLVQITFALEKQLFNKLPDKQTITEKKRKDRLTQANISHFVNIVIYALLCIVLFSFLSEVFNEYNVLLPLTITLLFLVHPLHTEPINNIKSRDELLMLLMILLSLKSYVKFAITNRIKYLIFGVLFVFLGMLCKKNAMAILGLVPVVLYFRGISLKKILISTASVLGIIFMFLLMKKGVITTPSSREIKFFENPLVFEGTFIDRITVGLYSSWFYLKMLIFPKDLSFYYGYNQIPMADWSFWEVWASLLFYLALGVYGVFQLVKRNVLGLGIVIWIGVMLGVINVFFPIVGIVADRFAFTFSIGFCIVLGYLLLKLFKVDLTKEVYKTNLPNGFLVVLISILFVH